MTLRYHQSIICQLGVTKTWLTMCLPLHSCLWHYLQTLPCRNNNCDLPLAFCLSISIICSCLWCQLPVPAGGTAFELASFLCFMEGGWWWGTKAAATELQSISVAVMLGPSDGLLRPQGTMSALSSTMESSGRLLDHNLVTGSRISISSGQHT